MDKLRSRSVFLILLIGGIPFLLSAQSKSTLSEDQLIVREILFEGNKVTKDNILYRELAIKIGDTIQKMELIPSLERSKENLLNLSLFNFVNIEVRHFPGNTIDLLILVQERWYIWPTPIFEHGERNLSTFLKEPEWSKINYGMWLKWNNFRGRNELLEAKIRLGYKEQFVLQYEKPNLGANENHKISLSYSLSRQHRVNYITRDNKPVYFRDENDYALSSADAFIAYSYRPQLYSIHRFRLHFIDDWISDTVAMLNPLFFGDGYTRYRHFNMDYVFRYDIRDSKIYPLEGKAYKLKFQRIGLGLVNDYPFGSWEAEAVFFYHTKLASRFYFANVIKGKTASNKAAPLIQLEAFGGAENLTAYDAFVINGSDYIVNKLIFKYQLLQPTLFSFPFFNVEQFSKVHFAIYLNLLGDIGYVNNNTFVHPSNYMVNSLQYSTGIGLDFVTYYDKVLGIEFAVNRYGMYGFFFHVETPFSNW